jgi:hypothetical protein
MMLTPRARRTVSAAVEQLSDSDLRDKWRAWERRGATGELPSEITAIARDALHLAERNLQKRLDTASLDENEEADILNDLGYIHAIETGLKVNRSRSRRAG